MKKLQILFCLATLLIIGNVQSSTFGTALIDWGTLTINTTGTLSLSFAEPFSAILGVGIGDFSDNEANNAVSGSASFSSVGLFSQALDGNARSTSVTNATDLPGSIAGPSGVILAEGAALTPTLGPMDFINTRTDRIVEVTASGAGTATFTVDFGLHSFIGHSDFSAVALYASLGTVTANANFTAFTSRGDAVALLAFTDGTDKFDDLTGTLVYSIVLNDMDVFNLGADARVDMRAFSAVPLPATAYLMFGACAMLVRMRRRIPA
jgi:hypothetical protein